MQNDDNALAMSKLLQMAAYQSWLASYPQPICRSCGQDAPGSPTLDSILGRTVNS